MDTLLDKLEFGNIKQLRKNLMLISAIGIIVSQLVKYSDGDVSFFGFNIPYNKLPLLNKLIWWIILYFFLALMVRFYENEFQKYYRKKLSKLDVFEDLTRGFADPTDSLAMQKFQKKS